MQVKIGCCGFCCKKADYFANFDVIELQETFYQPKSKERYEKLRSEAPQNFEFTVKAWQLITHAPSSPTYRRLKLEIPENKKEKYGFFKPTDEVFEAWQKIAEVAEALEAKIILFQTPASFKASEENKQNMREFFASIKESRFTFVWEPRNWPQAEIAEICKELKLVHCVDPFKEKPVYGDFNYFRLHGLPNYNLRYRYTEEDLKKLASFCNKELNYVLFNNLAMCENALEFKELYTNARN